MEGGKVVCDVMEGGKVGLVMEWGKVALATEGKKEED